MRVSKKSLKTTSIRNLFIFKAKYTQSEFGFKISRVTGLDAAGPEYEKATAEVRIDKTDAEFVDLIHTNGGDETTGVAGIHMPCGHADFYPNGGNKQTGCGGELINKLKKIFFSLVFHQFFAKSSCVTHKTVFLKFISCDFH